MKVAFFKSKYGNILDKLISFWTQGPYSHCELIFKDNLSFSARFGELVGFKEVEYKEGQWDFVEVGEPTSELYAFCEEQIGKRYDVLGVLGFVIQIFRTNRYCWFCSEIVTGALQKKKLLLDVTPCRINPSELGCLLLVFK
jgi:hypothetical protein